MFEQITQGMHNLEACHFKPRPHPWPIKLVDKLSLHSHSCQSFRFAVCESQCCLALLVSEECFLWCSASRKGKCSYTSLLTHHCCTVGLSQSANFPCSLNCLDCCWCHYLRIPRPVLCRSDHLLFWIECIRPIFGSDMRNQTLGSLADLVPKLYQGPYLDTPKSCSPFHLQ